MVKNVIEKALNFVKTHKVIFYLLGFVVAVVFPIVFDSNYMRGVAVRTLLYMLFASSLNIINGYGGQFSIGHAGFMCVGCYTGALLATKAMWGFWTSMIVCGVVTALFGLLVFLPTNKLSGIYLSIVTMGFAEIIRIIVLNWTSFTNGPLGVKGIPHIFVFGFEIKKTFQMYYVILFLLVVSLFLMDRILNSRVGRAWMSIRENQDAASSLGVEPALWKAINFMTGAFFCGVAGCFMAYYYRYIDTTMFTLEESINCLSMVVVGGMGTFVGPLVGSLVINLITEVFRFASEYRMLIYGVLIIATMWVRPQGICGSAGEVATGKPAGKKKSAERKA